MRTHWAYALATYGALVALTLSASPASAQTACETQCIAITGGCPSTIVCPGGGFCFGTPGDDCIFGTPTADFIFAGAGNDCVCGDAGDDTINGDAGTDTIFAGEGTDTVNGGDDPDLIQGDEGADNLNGDDGNDIILGGIGNDTVSGGPGEDTINGDEGNDVLEGGADDDIISGQGGSDTLRGGEGNDELFGQDGPDELDGGPGLDELEGGGENDTLIGGDDADLLDGGDGDDTLLGNDGDDLLLGQAGSDELDGGIGNDELRGGTENDTLSGGEGEDVILGGDGDDFISGGPGIDTLDGEDGEDTINGDAGNDIINGGTGLDVINGGPDDDFVLGGEGPDIINGDDGDDNLNGEGENDRIDGGAGIDTVSGGPGTDVCINFAMEDLTCDLLTRATVDSFAAFLERGTRVLRWSTSSESGTLGFRVVREEDGRQIPVHDGLLPGLLDAPQGGVYDLRDDGTPLREAARYWLIEVEVGGLETQHGPYDVRPTSEGESVIAAGHGYGRSPHIAPSSARVEKSEDFDKQSPGDPVAVYFGVEETGLYEVSAEDIAARLAVSSDTVRDWIEAGNLSLTEDDRRIAWSAAEDGSSIAFFGQVRENLYTTERFYRLSVGAGDSVALQSGVPGPATDGLTFVGREHLEDNAIPGILVSQDPDDDYWFWQLVTATEVMPIDASVTFGLESVAGGGTLLVRFHGISDEAHMVDVELNGTLLGTTAFDGITRHDAEFEVPDGVFSEGDNTLVIRAPEPSDSMLYLDSADVRYTRNYATTRAALPFGADLDASVSIDGIDGTSPRVFDVTDPTQPIELVDVAVDDGAVTLAVESGREYFIATAEATLSPSSSWADVASNWRNGAIRARHVIIAPAPFTDEAEALAEYRRADGLTSEVVELQDIFDEFSFGTPDPNAIRAFLAYAYDNWEEPPEFVVLAGDGSFDFRDVYGFGGNFIPPLMALSLDGILSSDSLLGDVAGSDGLAEIAVGRLPVSSEAALEASIARIIDYEGAFESLDDRALLLADATDELQGGDFASLQDSLAIALPEGWSATSVYRTDFEDAASTRSAFVDAVQDAPRVVNYFGHSGTTALGLTENLFDVEDVDTLDTTGAPPIFAMMTCGLSRFAVPSGLLTEGVSLGEALALDPTVGVAVIGSSGESVHQRVIDVSTAFFDELSAGREARLGSIVNRVFRTLDADGAELTRELAQVYHVFGDPALRVAKVVDSGPGGTGGTGGSSNGTGGNPGSGGTVTLPPETTSGGGCHATPGRGAPWAILVAMFLLPLAVRRRRDR
ncbi:MAG: C25 family cysteine peptidase [Myxococcota bacterium]